MKIPGFAALQKKLDALQQNHLPYAADIVLMLFFSTPSFGGYWPGLRTPAFLSALARWAVGQRS